MVLPVKANSASTIKDKDKIIAMNEKRSANSNGEALGQVDGKRDAKADVKSRLSELERHRRELQDKVKQARQKEMIALMQLNRIKTKLNVTNDALNKSKNKLHKTEKHINECENKIVATRTEQEVLTDDVIKRLREIYEGQRLTMLEMLFQVSSLQSLLDLFYYQEKIAEQDKQLLEELRAKALLLTAKRSQLGNQKNKLGGLVSEFARLASMLNREKLNQQQVADRLRTQRAFYEQAERQLAAESLQLEHQILDLEKRNNKNMIQGSGKLALPLHASVTSPFGWRRHPIFGVKKFHTGIDLAGPNHSQIRAADSGNVLYSGWYGGYGKVVIVSHGKGMATLYAHLSKAAVATGQNVSKGDVIGYEGTTGFSTGPHLHFEVRVNGKPNNPLNFVRM
jgi:murein DD-endopeptidase MepM/ murein hydrolase activator NlpD